MRSGVTLLHRAHVLPHCISYATSTRSKLQQVAPLTQMRQGAPAEAGLQPGRRALRSCLEAAP